MKMKAPEGMASCSHGGRTFHVGADGIVEVDDAAVPELMAHGLKVPEPEPEPPAVKVEEDRQQQFNGKPKLRK